MPPKNMDQRSTQDGDVAWLLKQIPKNDLLGFQKSKINELLELILASEKPDLPKTIGLFGTWGTGKTTVLAMLADKLNRLSRNGDYFPVIYFNAWKYAGFMEVVPALIYKILKYVAPENDPSVGKKISKVMLSLGKKYSDQFGNWTEHRFGLNFTELAKDAVLIKKSWTQEEKRLALLDQYYTQVDKAQDTLRELFEGRKNPAVVMVDELDRCDPGEAFEVIKKLRVFFSMRGIPIVFVLSVNPDPVGAAIRHQYGLDSGISDYETRRILEKFVDAYIDMSDPVSLRAFVRHQWVSGSRPYPLGIVHRLDRDNSGEGYESDTVRGADAFLAMETDNYLYSNIRILKKSFDHVTAKGSENDPQIWTKWHLEILSQAHLSLRRKVAKIAEDITDIAVLAHLSLFNRLSDLNQLNAKTGRVDRPAELKTPEGNTAFSIYRSFFWEQTRQRTAELKVGASPEQLARNAIVKDFLLERYLMDFIIIMSLIGFREDLDILEFSTGINERNEEAFRHRAEMAHFSWSVSNY